MTSQDYFNRKLPFPSITLGAIATGPAPFIEDLAPFYRDEEKEKEMDLDFPPIHPTAMELLQQQAIQKHSYRLQLEEDLQKSKAWNVILCIAVVACSAAAALAGVYWQMAVNSEFKTMKSPAANPAAITCPIGTINTGKQCKLPTMI